MKRIILISIAGLFALSCNNTGNQPDASGTFEAVETIISAQTNGILESYTVEEGQVLKAGELVGTIDSTQVYLKKQQLEAQINAVLSKRPNVAIQLAALREKLEHDITEQKRINNLYQSDAATKQQLDNINAKVAMDRKQIAAMESTLRISSSSLKTATTPITFQIAQLEDQLQKCKIINPIKGTVLTNYAEAKEMAARGKPLYKIADLSTLILRAYITGDQFAKVKLNQKVKVLVDNGKGDFRKYDGVVEWISDKAEFTPKTIQTKEERAHLVYAIKVRVRNDGYLKIGMYGEVKF